MLNLIVNLYIDPDPARDAELAECRKINAIMFDRFVSVEGRPTYAELFRRANDVTGPTDINCIANADIYADASIRLTESMTSDECYGLCRWDKTDGAVRFYDHRDSADVFVFRGKIRDSLIEKANFPQGKRGCDNRLMALIRDAGYRVSNPSRDIRTIHLHETGIRRYGAEAVPRPYLLVTPHHLGDIPVTHWMPA